MDFSKMSHEQANTTFDGDEETLGAPYIQYSLCGILGLFCCPPLPKSIGNKLAFIKFPSTYQFKETSSINAYNLNLLHTSGWGFSENNLKKVKCGFAYSASGNNIACVYINMWNDSPFTILFSHGNAVDNGHTFGYMLELVQKLGLNVFTYDYSGYGLSGGTSTEKNVCQDIRAAYKYLVNDLKVDAKTIVLYGQSIGTVPTIDLAGHEDFAGVIIHSGLASGLRVLFPKLSFNLFCDVFRSDQKISKVKAPVLVMHGKRDDIVPFNNGLLLHKNCLNPVEPLWLDDASHNDIEVFPQFYKRLIKFFSEDLRSFPFQTRSFESSVK